jgi:hypothetical protein
MQKNKKTICKVLKITVLIAEDSSDDYFPLKKITSLLSDYSVLGGKALRTFDRERGEVQ